MNYSSLRFPQPLGTVLVLVDNWVDRVFQDSALAGGVSDVDREPDVSGLSPAGSPAVLHDPVWGVSGGVKTNGEDSVVEGVSAGVLSDDSTPVVLEHKVVLDYE